MHELAGERRAFRLAHTTDEAKALLRRISSHDSEEPLTSLEIKIAGDGTTTTRFGTATPLVADGLAARMDRIYGAIARARPPTLPAVGCIPGLFRAIFGPKLKLYPLPRLQHLPLRESLATLLEPVRGIREGWDEPLDPATTPSPQEMAAAAERLARLQKLAAEAEVPRAAGDAVGGEHLVVPETEGEVVPVRIDALRATLMPVSLHGRRLYSCWLVGAPYHTKVGLDFSIGVDEDRLSYGLSVNISEV